LAKGWSDHQRVIPALFVVIEGQIVIPRNMVMQDSEFSATLSANDTVTLVQVIFSEGIGPV
jgi:hypothetical protein